MSFPTFPMVSLMFLSREETLLYSCRRKLKVKFHSQITKNKCHVKKMTLLVQLTEIPSSHIPQSFFASCYITGDRKDYIVTLIWTITKENTNFNIKIILDRIGAIYSQWNQLNIL